MFKTNTFAHGRLVRDPETSTSKTGVEITKFTLACDEYDRSKKENVTHFVDCVAFSGLGSLIASKCEKGKEIAVSGELQIDEYESKKYWNEAGKFAKMTSVSLIVGSMDFCGKKDDSNNTSSTGTSNGSSNLEPIGNDDGALPF